MMESGQKEREVLGRAADAWLERGIGRRGFLAVLAAAGLGGIGTWYGLSRKRPTQVASTLEDQLGPRSASLPETSQHKFLEEMGKRFHGTTLRVVTENTAPSKATSFLVQKEFEPLTGIKIEWELLPLEQVLARTLSVTGQKAGLVDVFYWDQSWVGRFVEESVTPLEFMGKKGPLAVSCG